MSEEFKLALEALGKDIALWDGVSDRLQSQTSRLSALSDAPSAMTMVGSVVECAQAFLLVHAWMTDLLAGGVARTGEVGDLIKQVLAVFEKVDEEQARTLSIEWKPVLKEK